MRTLDTYELANELAALEDDRDALEAEGRTLKPECRERLEDLSLLAGEIPEFGCGNTPIHEDDLAEYAEQFAWDALGLPSDGSWPMNHIDWKAAADDLRVDYSTVEWEGETYLVRS